MIILWTNEYDFIKKNIVRVYDVRYIRKSTEKSSKSIQKINK